MHVFGHCIAVIAPRGANSADPSNAILQAGAQRVSFGHAVHDRRQHLPRLFFERALWRKHAHCENVRFVLHLQLFQCQMFQQPTNSFAQD